MASWPIKISRLALICSILGPGVPAYGDVPAPSKFVAACEKVLIHTGLWHPQVRASLVDSDGLDLSAETAAYHPSSYTTYFLNDLSYYPVRFLSRGYLQGKRVLDLSSGNGAFVEELRRADIDAVGLSIQLTPYQLSKPYFIQASAMRTGLPDRSADVIIATLSTISLFYEQDPATVQKILREAKRVLRKGGTMLISPIHIPVVNPGTAPDVSAERLLAGTVFSRLPEGLRVKSAPDRAWLSVYRDAQLDQGRPRRANYWLELERTD